MNARDPSAAATRDVVVIGLSRGGLEVLRTVLRELPPDFPAAMLVVAHIGAHHSILPSILSQETSLPVAHAGHGEALRYGEIVVAPPDCHLLLTAAGTLLSHGAKENFARPAIDPLFRSAALSKGPAVVGILLSGDLDDGCVGLQAIKDCGGAVIVQDPATAESESMPRHALAAVQVDACVAPSGIAQALLTLMHQPSSEVSAADKRRHLIDIENRFLLGDPDVTALADIAKPTTFTCPECHGTLWEVEQGGPARFRCHTGHGYTAASLAHGQAVAAEEAVWAAVRALHEKEMLLRRMAQTAAASGRHVAASERLAEADAAAAHAATLRAMTTEAAPERPL
ncbi:chemotaxis protein CheB [Pigmentiphaga litoralis]|uniref:protein-glutamate methylesterase n=1 Tax=Pigmentiphaga litoralis TaxID=516702 RepID=A0A7Y9LP48_9BURK|nr:two-component system chemotaxis response regulator CheB [Pigmentiphaga litoralis]NYE84015.1 two-component system chemotaxis response regulator CheB [Pigmentiphaga litoralis]